MTDKKPRTAPARPGRSFGRVALAVIVALLAATPNRSPLWAVELVASAEPPQVTRFALDNGLRVSLIHIESDIAVSMFTCLPQGLIHDEAGQMLWIRLAERLSTQLSGESEGSVESDYMVLQSWCRPEQCQETMRAHAMLMRRLDLSRGQLSLFKEDMLMGMRHAASFQPEKVALAMFAQGYRYGRTSVSIHQEINAAALEDIRACHDRHWSAIQGALVCVIGPVPADQLKPVVVREFGAIPSAKPVATRPAATASRYLKMAWDDDSRALVMAWPLPTISVEDEAALAVVARLVEAAWQKKDEDGRACYVPRTAGVLKCAEGPFFALSLIVDPGESLAKFIPQVRHIAHRLADDIGSFEHLVEVQRQVSRELLMPNVPLISKPKMENSARLFDQWLRLRQLWAELEWRHGDRRSEIGRLTAGLAPQDISAVARKYLTDKACIVCTIRPQGERPE